MITLPETAVKCPTESAACNIVAVERRIRGWVGIQRYLDETDFGLDLIRNGRKIELANKDLFVWRSGEATEIEYPIDDPRKRGRFVGEIHVDHCRVSYTKDRFERDDPAWEEMVRVVRGEGPLQPQKAKGLGFGANGSPLYRLFQAFRRSSPQGKNGLWSRILVVKDNDRAREMATRYQENDPEYLDDEKWWQLVQEQDNAVLGGADPTSPGGPAPPPADIPPGFFDTQPPTLSPDGGTPPAASPAIAQPPTVAPRRPIFELTRKYVHPTYRVEYEVQGFLVAPNDPDLGAGHPWTLKLTDVATRTYAFLVDASHDLYRSTTMTPLDALLTELSYRTIEFLRQTAPDATFAAILADFRREYSLDSRLDPVGIITEATTVLAQIAQSLPGNLPQGDGKSLYDGLSEPERVMIGRKMVARGVTPKDAIASGGFLAHAEPQTVQNFFKAHPELFLDGKFWEDAYATLDYGSASMTDEAKQLLVSRFNGYMADAVWLASQTPSDLERIGRDALIRSTLSLKLLQPDKAE